MLLFHANGLEKVTQSPCSSFCTYGLAPGEGGDTATSVILQRAAVEEKTRKGRRTEAHCAEELLRGMGESAMDSSRHVSGLG